MNIFKIMLAGAVALTAGAGAAQASETEFLKSLHGQWTGKGSVRIRTNLKPISVSCNFTSGGGSSSLELDGRCKGLVVFSRAISADLVSNGASYSGAYTGAGTGKAGLAGTRKGNEIALQIRWAKEVNGDRSAMLSVRKLGDNGMQLVTMDRDPKTGKQVVTSDINLRRK